MTFKKFLLFCTLFYQTIISMDKPVIDAEYSYEKEHNTLLQRNSRNHFRDFSHDNVIRLPVSDETKTVLNILQQCQSNEQVFVNQQLTYLIDVLSKANSFSSINAVLALEHLNFQSTLLNQDLASQYQWRLQNTINKLNYILYDYKGNPRPVFTNNEKYEIAKIITNELIQPLQPDYIKTIEHLALLGRPGFDEVYKNLTEKKSFSDTIKGWTRGLCKGVQSCFSFMGPPEALQELIKKNDFRNDLISLQDHCRKNQFSEAKRIIDKYKQDQQKFTLSNNLYHECLHEYTEKFIRRFQIQSSPELIAELIELVPYIIEYPSKTAELYYAKLEQYKDDNRYYILKQLMNEYGLPLFYHYDEALLRTFPLPKTITNKEHIREQHLLFNLVTCRNKQEQDAILLGIRYISKACTSQYSSRYSGFAKAILTALESKNNDKTILHCSDFTQTQPVLAKESMLRRVLPAIANLSNEINRLKQNRASEERIKYLQSLLIKLNKKFEALDDSYTTQKTFNKTITEVLKELKAFERSELYLSPSQKNLLAYLKSQQKKASEVLRNYEDILKSEVQTIPLTTADWDHATKKEIKHTQNFDIVLTDRSEHLQIDPTLIQELIKDQNTPKNVIKLLQQTQQAQETVDARELATLGTTVADLLSYATLLQAKITAKDAQREFEKAQYYQEIKDNIYTLVSTIGEYSEIFFEELNNKRRENCNFIFMDPLERLQQISTIGINFAKMLLILSPFFDDTPGQSFLRAQEEALGIVSMEQQSLEKFAKVMEPFEKADAKGKFRISVKLGLEAATQALLTRGCTQLKQSVSLNTLKLSELQVSAKTAEELAVLKQVEASITQEQQLVSELEHIVQSNFSQATENIPKTKLSSSNQIPINNVIQDLQCPASCVNQYEKLTKNLAIEEITSVINVTKHGLERLLERGFEASEIISLVKSPDITKIQTNGLKVFIKKAGAKYNFMIINETTNKVVTGLRHISFKKVQNLSKNYGWEI